MNATTADCKNYLVDQIRKNPAIIHNIFRDTTTAISEALNKTKWKRECKFSATGNHDYADYTYGLYAGGSLPAADFAWVRRFCLDPDQFDTAVIFNILEDHQGNLYLGEYVGD
jgi:hypothetical protein